MIADVGRLCVKTAGRDAGKVCIIVEKIDQNTVLIDGATRRRKCNIHHLEISPMIAKIKAKADHATVLKALEELGFPLKEKASYTKKERKPKKVAKVGVLSKLAGKKKEDSKKPSKK